MIAPDRCSQLNNSWFKNISCIFCPPEGISGPKKRLFKRATVSCMAQCNFEKAASCRPKATALLYKKFLWYSSSFLLSDTSCKQEDIKCVNTT